MRMRRAGHTNSEKGFTIVELMIALSVLSVLLITTTIVMIQIGALYSKGVNAADLQNTTRNVVADISGQLQFSGTAPIGCVMNDAAGVALPPAPLAPAQPNTTCAAHAHNYGTNPQTSATVYSYCIGNTRYSYVMNRELGGDGRTTPAQITPHVLWRDKLRSAATACPPLDITVANPSDANTVPNTGYELLGNHMRLTRFDIHPSSTTNGTYSVDVWTAFGDSDLVQTDGTGRPTCQTVRGTEFCSTSIIRTQLTGRVY